MDHGMGRGAGLGPGAMVMTTDGELPVEWLESGDRVITRDHGAQPILWIERWKGSDPKGRPLPGPLQLLPDPKALQDTLIEPLRLAPQHRVMVHSPLVELHFAEHEVLAEIGDLDRFQHVRQDKECPTVTYHNLILARHELIWTCGIWVESVGPDTTGLLRVPAHVRMRSEVFDAHALDVRTTLQADEAGMIQSLLMPGQSVMDLLAA